MEADDGIVLTRQETPAQEVLRCNLHWVCPQTISSAMRMQRNTKKSLEGQGILLLMMKLKSITCNKCT
jgi:hypothetical protein